MLRNKVRLWDSLSVTFELGAAALFSVLFFAPSPSIAGFFAALISGTGLVIYVIYGTQFASLWRSDEKAQLWEHILAWASVVPATAYLIAATLLWTPLEQVDLLPWLPFTSLELFALAVTWLALSGTLQALLWYLTSWESPSSSARRPDQDTLRALD